MHVSASFGARKVIPGTSGDVESFSSGSGQGEAGGESAFCGRFADPRPVILPRARRFPVERAPPICAFDWKPTRSRKIGDGLAGPGDGRDPRDQPGRPGPGWVTGPFPDQCSRGPSGVVEVVTAIVGAPAAPATRPAAALPDRSAPADCPNLPQRPRPSRSAREETLIFRGFIRGRSRRGAPLWQIWTTRRRGLAGGGWSSVSARFMTSASAWAPARRAVVDRVDAPFDRAGPAGAPPGPRAGAPIRENVT